jgi:hypothetical protein
MAKHWIQSAIKHPGALTRKAKAAGETVAQFIANPPKNMSSTTAKEVALAKTLRKLHHPK